MNDSLENIVGKVLASIPPTVRTGLFIDLFAPDGRWYHGVRYMVDYGDAMDCDEREGPAVTTGTPVVCTTIVKEDSVRFDARHLHGLPDDSLAYDTVVEIELDGILDGETRPTDIRRAYDDYLDEITDHAREMYGPEAFDTLMETYRLVFRLSDLTERHLVVERGRSWKLAE